MNKQAELDKLRQEILEQNICPELAANATNLVMGEGDFDARIILIGEAPGKKEDETGRPFVGVAGKFLDEMLARAGLERADVYITNIVKYRPPNNRDPLASEKEAFSPYLLKQLEIINPKIIVTLGRHSGAHFLPNLVISRDHGQATQVRYYEKKLLVVPLYHPAAALYNGGLRQTLIDDFIKMAEHI